MEIEKRKSITIVNRYYPPDSSPISKAASDLASFLIKEGLDVHIVHTDGEYKTGSNSSTGLGERHIVKSIYNGTNKLLKFLASLIEGYRLIKKTIKIHSKHSGYVIIMTSPALLNYWAGKYLNKKHIPWIYWSLDLFPESLVATKTVKESNFIYKYIHKKVYANPPNYILALGQIQAEFLQAKFAKSIKSFVLPCGVFLNELKKKDETTSKAIWEDGQDKTTLAYIGNIGHAHSEQFLRWVIDYFEPSKQKLILRLYGTKAKKLIDYAEKKQKGIFIMDFVSDEHFSKIDIHLVSLKSNYVNVCVPSKMVSAVYNGASVLFYGIADCDNWQLMKDASWLINEQGAPEMEVKSFLQSITKESLKIKKQQAIHLPDLLLKNTIDIYTEISNLAKED